jgi:uncharacterized protein YndB with AHSA1/START domain
MTEDIFITRTFDAPREQVWKTWTDPELMKSWWGPKNFTAPVIESDFREGGRYLNAMRDAEGKTYWSTGEYKQIRKNEKIVVSDSFADENGNVVSGSYYGMPNIPDETKLTVTFEDQGGKTKLTLRHGEFHPADAEACRSGWNETLDKFAAALKKPMAKAAKRHDLHP